MAFKNQQGDQSNKRKRIPGGTKGGDGGKTSQKKKLKTPSNDQSNKGFKKPFSSSKHHHGKADGKPRFDKSDTAQNVPKTKRELRLQAKELAEARKKKRKPHYTLEQELALLWEKMRRRNIGKEDRSKLVSEALRKMKGKIHEIAGSHVSCRVLQTCAKYCSQDERNAVFEELRPHFLTLACNTYAVHLITKLLDNASKEQLAEFISSLHGHVASLLRHMVGSVVVEHAYQLGNATQKQALLMELYSTELQLFKDLVLVKERRLVDIISKLNLQKAAVMRHMSSVFQPILEKGIVDHSILHTALVEYFTIAGKSSAADVIQHLASALLVRMIHTKDGSKIGILCIKHGSAQERKKIIKGMKGHVSKIAQDRFGSMVLTCILSVVDDTQLIKKIIIRELQAVLKELILDKNGRRPLLQLLHPNCSRYLSPDDLSLLDSSIPSLLIKGDSEPGTDVKSSEVEGDENMSDAEENVQSVVAGGKKDPILRRKELLVDSGLAESLIDACCESAEELLRSNHGREVLFEVASGGADGILRPHLDEKLDSLHEAIATRVALPKSEGQEEEHLLENFHSSRTIRKLILECPSFASTLWKKAFKGKCKTWAQGHSAKVVCAYLETSDPMVLKLAKQELQPLLDKGVLKLPENNQPRKQAKQL
ncbi:pumilio homolog 24 [Cynara cardunculus var. scolymus]|uniref:pumilio homolog 24 n=1 Tax=Cynara cardunculus var. scolymus TaxID=59895 RepID=UPI000D630D1A|nr:pumilio homolog 24 [Cynara cardunculus var. scolymus]